MKSLKVKLLTIIILCFAVSNIANAFTCPMMLQSANSIHSNNKDISSHCEKMNMAQEKTDTQCDNCKCLNCVQISNINFANQYHQFKISKNINSINKHYNEFKILLLSPPPKIS